MPKHTVLNFESALDDFHLARRKAAIQAILSRISGKSAYMLSFDEVRAKLGGIEFSYRELKDIPLDSIIGTVSRDTDFSRTLLPLNESAGDRWAMVRLATEKMEGLPPIDVYQVGDAYFIRDGHHRASVAREIGATHIQAYVRQVRTLVPVTPTDRIEDIILKSEYIDFLNKTNLNDSRPGADLRMTVPGEYDKLLEHISVHRYYQGLTEHRKIPFPESSEHWYDVVYQPVALIIRERNMLKDFPERSEADLYMWIMDHRTSLEDELGWKVTPQTAVNDFTDQFQPRIIQDFRRSLRHFFGAITPEEIVPTVHPGEWRRKRARNPENLGLFHNILVAVTGDPVGWKAVDLAIGIAANEDLFLGGLHLIPPGGIDDPQELQEITSEFNRRCEEKNIEGSLLVESGDVTKILYNRSSWADLMVLRMLYPPPFKVLTRLRSGLRTLIRISRVPLWVYPVNAATTINCAVLAYGGGPRADEALFVATYLAAKWGVRLTVVTVDRGRPGDEKLAERARTYLSEHSIDQVEYVFEKADPASIILFTAETTDCDLVIMGGYENNLVSELIVGSTVDRVLWSARRSVLICQ